MITAVFFVHSVGGRVLQLLHSYISNEYRRKVWKYYRQKKQRIRIIFQQDTLWSMTCHLAVTMIEYLENVWSSTVLSYSFYLCNYAICHVNIFSLLLSQTNLHFNKLCVNFRFGAWCSEASMYSLYTFFVRLCGRSHFFGTGADFHHADKRG